MKSTRDFLITSKHTLADMFPASAQPIKLATPENTNDTQKVYEEYLKELSKNNFIPHDFIKIEGDQYNLPSELNIDKNNITTFYSLIPNKHRKTPTNAIEAFKS